MWEGLCSEQSCTGFSATTCTTGCKNVGGKEIYTYAPYGTVCSPSQEASPNGAMIQAVPAGTYICDGHGTCFRQPSDSPINNHIGNSVNEN